MEGYLEWVTGLMMSGYFLGFIVGTLLCSRLIPKVGQIRVFAAFASLSSAISLIHVLFLNEITWILLRVVYGICIAALYMVIESWLNALSTRKNRGRILSVYMAVSFLSLAVGQLFIFTGDPGDYMLFAVVSVLVSCSLVPVTLSKSKQPEEIATEHFSFRKLITISPLATIGSLSTGFTLGAFWGLGAVYFTQIGLVSNDVAVLIGLTFLGGLLFQWPIGLCSDAIDRRWVIAAVLACSVIVCINFVALIDEAASGLSLQLMLISLFFGGFNYTLYSLFIALANDFLKSSQIVKASAGLLIFHSIGAICGPVIASLGMVSFGPKGLFITIGLINAALFGFATLRIIKGRQIPEATSEQFVSMPKTAMAVTELDPRQNENH